MLYIGIHTSSEHHLQTADDLRQMSQLSIWVHCCPGEEIIKLTIRDQECTNVIKNIEAAAGGIVAAGH